MLCRTRRAGNCDLVIDGLRAIASSPEPSFQTPGKKMPRNSEAFAILAWNLGHQFQQSRRAESVLTFSFQAEHFGVLEDPGCAPASGHEHGTIREKCRCVSRSCDIHAGGCSELTAAGVE